jgi:hypothetical protein
MSEPRPSQEELNSLEREIPERFPGWVFVGLGAGYGEWYLAAEKVGTIPDRQYGSSPRKLLEAIAQRVEQQSRSRAVGVQHGAGDERVNVGDAVEMMLKAAEDYADNPCAETFERFELACEVFYAVGTSRVGGRRAETQGRLGEPQSPSPSETPTPAPARMIATREHG